MGETTISWTARPGTVARTWNPTQGCALKSEGCRNCYAMRQARRFAGHGKPFDGLINLKTGKWTGEARLAAHKLDEPLSWRAPSTVFVDSMSDLFYEGFTNEQIDRVFAVMLLAPRHTFQILTKRPARMRQYMTDPRLYTRVLSAAGELRDVRPELNQIAIDNPTTCPKPWIWLGVSVENQTAADERIPELLATPAAVRFLSCEPLLGAVTLHEEGLDWLTSYHCRGIDWVIAGAESGPRARACDVQWLRSLRDQCAAASVPFFLKQAVAVDGAYTIHEHRPLPSVAGRIGELVPIIGVGQGSREKGRGFGGPVIELPYLDGKQHAEFPR